MNDEKKKKLIHIEKQDLYFIISMILLGMLIRLFFMRYRFAITFDEVNYLKMAASGALNGLSHVFHPYWSPFYPLVVAVFSKVIPSYELIGRLVSVFSGVLVIIPVYMFTSYHFDRKIARYTALFLALLPGWAFSNTAALTEALYVLLATTGVFVGWFVLNNRRWGYSLAVGVLFGLAYLTRPEGLGFLIVFVGLTMVLTLYGVFRKTAYRTHVISLVVAVIGFVAVASPYLLYLHKSTGEWTISVKGKSNQQNVALKYIDRKDNVDPFRTLSPDNTEVPMDQKYHIGNFLQAEKKRGKPLVKVTPAILIKKYATNLYRIIDDVIPKALTTVIFILMILGLFGEVWSRERALRNLYLLSYVLFFWFVVIPSFHVTVRYILPFLPLCLIWAAKGIDTMIKWSEKTLHESLGFSHPIFSNRRLAVGFVLLFVLFGTFLPQLSKVLLRDKWSTDYGDDPIEQKIAGLWLKEHVDKTPVIMSRNHAVDFYAGNYNIVESVTIPKNELPRVLEYAKHRGVDYLVLNERYAEAYPKIAYLLDEINVPDNLKLIYKIEPKPGLKTVIYKLIKDEQQD